jgi:hypothetical protein
VRQLIQYEEYVYLDLYVILLLHNLYHYEIFLRKQYCFFQTKAIDVFVLVL